MKDDITWSSKVLQSRREWPCFHEEDVHRTVSTYYPGDGHPIRKMEAFNRSGPFEMDEYKLFSVAINDSLLSSFLENEGYKTGLNILHFENPSEFQISDFFRTANEFLSNNNKELIPKRTMEHVLETFEFNKQHIVRYNPRW